MTDRIGAPTVAQDDRIYGALELSRESWLVVLRVGVSGRLSRHRLAAGDVAGLLGVLDRAGRGRGMRAASCYEAGPDGFWLHRRLVAAGVENVVIDATSVAVDRRSRRRKTDRLDGEAMVQALIEWLGGKKRALRVVAVPSPALEDARRTERERGRLVKERTGHMNRMRGLLTGLGIAAGGRLAAPDWPAWLDRQRQWDGTPVPVHLAAELGREHARLMQIDRQLAALACAPASLPPEAAKQADALLQLKGVGRAISTGLAGEALWRGFTNRRQVGAYLGLDPSPWQSGAVAHEQGIGRAGNRRARTLMIQAAWLWLQHQPGQALSRWFHDKVGDRTGWVRRSAIVALARKLAVLFWRIATTGLIPDDVQLKPAAMKPAAMTAA